MSNTLKRFGSNIGKISFSGLEQTNKIVNATGETATEVIKVPGAFASTANKGFETANTTLDIAQRLGIASSDATTNVLNQGVQITEGVSTNAVEALLTTKHLLKTSNETLKATLENISPHIAKTSGNAGEISSSLSGLAAHAVNTSVYLTETLLAAIKYPFQLARTETNPRKKIETSFNLIRRRLTKLYVEDLKTIIRFCDISIKSFQTQTCKRTRFFSLNCGDSQSKIDSMKGIKMELELKLKDFQRELKSIFKRFTTEMASVTSETPEILLTKADKIKESVVLEADKLFNESKPSFDEKLESIKSPLTKLFEENERRLRGITEEQSEQSEQSDELREPEELEGGKKQKRKRKTKRNKSHRKHRTVKRV